MTGRSPMPPERWERIKLILEEAIDRPPAERAAYLAGIAGDDAALALEVRSLLAAHLEAGTFIESPAIAKADIASVLDSLQATPTWVGRRVGPYLLVREIGHGGMGAVYLAVRADDEYRKQVAFKVIRSSFEPAIIQQRFRDERQILADLDHPNIARLIDGGSTVDGEPYLVMDYIDGLPIDEYCDANALTVDQRLSLFLEVCSAVEYAHQHLVVHRDIKNSNIMIGADGVPKLLDFGIAKLVDPDPHAPAQTLTALRPLTIESASPEQVRGETVTTSTDVYALGVLLYRLLTGQRPYNPPTGATHDLARAICEDDPRRPSDAAGGAESGKRLRGDLDVIVLKAMQKDPSRRYATVEQFARDITRHLAGRPVLAQADTIGYRSAKFVRRHKAAVFASALLVVSLIAGVIATAWQAHVARVQRSRAERRFNDVRRLATSFLFEVHDAIENLPGSTKARELVVRRASEYLDGLASEAGNDASLQREVAAAYDKVGDVQGLPAFANLGDTAGALRSHFSALALRQSLAAAAPEDATLQGELVITEGHLGSILQVTKDLPAALDHARKALAIRERLLSLRPDGPAERNALAAAHHRVGSILTTMGDWAGALDSVQRETGEFERLLALDPSSDRAQRNAAIAYRQLGALQETTGRRADAIANYGKAAALDERRLAASPKDRQTHLDLSFDYASLGYTLSTMGDVAGSLARYAQALELREWAAAADPNDVSARDTVVRAHLSIGQVLRGAGRQREAIPRFEKAREIAAARYAADPTNAIAGGRLANVYGALAGTYAALGAAPRNGNAPADWRQARAWAQRSLDLIRKLNPSGSLAPGTKTEVDGLEVLVTRANGELTKPASPRVTQAK